MYVKIVQVLAVPMLHLEYRDASAGLLYCSSLYFNHLNKTV